MSARAPIEKAALPGGLDPVAVAVECEEVMSLAKKGSFYGPCADMGLGTGIIVQDVVQPRYLPEARAYGTARGPAIVLTHECDIDPDNVRPFSDNALIAPIIRLDAYIDSVKTLHRPADTRALLLNVASGKTSRLFFLPRFGDNSGPLYFGGIVDFNYLTSCGIAPLAEATRLCSLTGYALKVLDFALQEHLMRPKADQSPLPH